MIERVKRHQKTHTKPEVKRSALALAGLAGPEADFGVPTATTTAVADPSLGHEFDQVGVDGESASRERTNEGGRAQLDEDLGIATESRTQAGEARADADTDDTDDADDDGQMVIIDDQEVPGAGQMRKSEFLEQLRESVRAAVAYAGPEAVAKATERFEQGVTFYATREAADLEADLRREVSEATRAAEATDYITAVVGRVERVVERAERAEREQERGERGAKGEQSGPASSSESSSWLSFEPPRGESPLATLRLHGKGRGGRLVEAGDPLAIQEQLGDGVSLGESVRRRMETAFDQSFAGVRLHTDGAAAALAAELDSRAFSVGNHVAFASGEYKPGTLEGDALIAHELAHVLQQGDGVAEDGLDAKANPESAGLEEDADLSATGAMASLYLGARGSLAELGRSAAPRFKSGLGLRRCGPSATATAVTFPGYSEIVGDGTMKSTFDTEWANTKADCTETPNQRRERGCWIQWNKDTSKFSTTTMVMGKWVGPTEGASVNPYPIAPDADPVFTVGSFHTHTSTEYRSKKTGRGVGPSDADVSSDNNDDTAGVVYDYIGTGGNIYGGTSKDAPAKLYHSGPNRRTKQ